SQYSERPALVAEWQIQSRGCRQGVRAPAGALTVIGYPLCDRQIRAAEGLLKRWVARSLQLPRGIRQQDDRAALEYLGDVTHGDLRHAPDTTRGGEFAAHGIKQRRAPFAGAGYPCLLTHACHQVRND